MSTTPLETPMTNTEPVEIAGENRFLYHTGNRLFINTVLGCLAKCEYCYLETIGLARGRIHSKSDCLAIINYIDSNRPNIWHPSNTLVSFGCYSEPWGKDSISDTIEIVKYLDTHKYKITLSTKQCVTNESLLKLNKVNRDRIYFLISLPAANFISSQEIGTSSLHQRIESIDTLRQHGFRVALYIKPFIANQTVRSFSVIRKIISTHNIPIILGKIFKVNGNGKMAAIGTSNNLHEVDNKEYYIFKRNLQKLTNVHENSYDIFDEVLSK